MKISDDKQGERCLHSFFTAAAPQSLRLVLEKQNRRKQGAAEMAAPCYLEEDYCRGEKQILLILKGRLFLRSLQKHLQIF